jgi:seryl-tRNA synthetase
MIELQLLLSNFEELAEKLEKRGIKKDFLFGLREKVLLRKKINEELNSLRREKNELAAHSEKTDEKGKETKKLILEKESLKRNLEAEIHELSSIIPNTSYSDKENNRITEEIFFKHEIKNNLEGEEIIRKLSLIDEKRSIKLSGSKFAVYKGLGSKLLRTLVNLMLKENEESGYEILDIPYLVSSKNPYNVGQLPKFKEDLYKIEGQDLFLIPTSETSLVNLYQEEIIKEEELPKKICSYSPCFRAEAGASGKENKGLVRLHQFHKVELVKIVKDEDSEKELSSLLKDAQKILKKLEISHRVIELSQKELGFSSSKTYDIELWLPNSKK